MCAKLYKLVYLFIDTNKIFIRIVLYFDSQNMTFLLQGISDININNIILSIICHNLPKPHS